MEDKIENYEYLWSDKDAGWALMKGVNHEKKGDIDYSIVNSKQKSILIIEDDAIHLTVVKKMLANNVPIFLPGEKF